MRQAATLFIFGLLLLVVFLIFFAKSVALVQRVAIVDSVVGSAELLQGGSGDPISLEAGKLVRAGDVIRTGPDSSVELRWARWAGGLRIRVGPNTSFTVTRAIIDRSSGREESHLRVDEGTVWVRLREALSGRSQFEVETPTAVATVRGTVFSVAVRPDGTSTVSVWKGKVGVRAAGRAEVTVSGGSQVTLTGGRSAPSPQPLTPGERREWLSQPSIVGPFLSVESPAEGATLDATTCTVSGRTEGDCEVFLNGAPVLLSDKAEFTATIELSSGEHRIDVMARAADGSETTVTRTVTVPLVGGAF
jgi:hypothetical protein